MLPDAGEGAQDPRFRALLDRVFTLGEMLSRETEQAEPLLGHFLRKGEVTILGGHGGQGKSTMGWAMTRAAVTSGEFLGATGEGLRAFVVDLEQGLGVAQRAVMRMFYPAGYEEGVPVSELIQSVDLGEVADRIHWADWRQGFGIDQWDVMFAAIEQVMDLHSPDLVLLDPIYKLFLGSNVNEGEIVGRLIGHVDAIRQRHPECAWLIPMHPRKPPSIGDKIPGMMDLYGSMYWSAWASSIFTIQRGKGNEATFRVCKDRLGALDLEDWHLHFHEGKGYQRDPGDMVSNEPKTTTGKIWRHLIDHAPVSYTRSELQEVLGLSKKQAAENTKKMTDLNNERGMYEGLRWDKGADGRIVYWYQAPPRKQAENEAVQQFMDEFDATEEV